MEYQDLVKGAFVRRDNRFRATVEIQGQEAWAHVANSGRLGELFTPGRPVWLAAVAAPHRKTAYDLKLVDYNGVLISVDARLPNPLFAEAFTAGRLTGFAYPEIQPEVAFGHSRLDFCLSGPDGVCWIETKSVTLVEDGVAMFPDAPTSRGRKHLETLIQLRSQGARAAVIFVVQRPDALFFRPYREADPDFALGLRQAAAAGVEVHAYTCQVSCQAITLAGEIPVQLF